MKADALNEKNDQNNESVAANRTIIADVTGGRIQMKTFKAILAAAALVTMVGCSGSSAAYKAGTYTGTAEGHNGNVSVEVTVSDSAITAVKVTEQAETAGIADGALNTLPDAIVKANSAEVDAVAGCTDTSEAIKEAVKAALAQAK